MLFHILHVFNYLDTYYVFKRDEYSLSDIYDICLLTKRMPLSEMFGYVTSLRTLSSGRATSTMEFSHYSETPPSVSETVISEIKGQSE